MNDGPDHDPYARDARVELAHGSGGRATSRLVRQLFLRHLPSPALHELHDGAVVPLAGPLAISTDAFVVDPLFFPGGDIGKLSVCGTVNDVAMCGARPASLAAAFVLEEGLTLDELERIVTSMAQTCAAAGVSIVTGDTKVVPRGKGDRVFVTTTGVGQVLPGVSVGPRRILPGDRILVSGPVGDHGTTILALRAGIELGPELRSDCAPVAAEVMLLLERIPQVHAVRDPTRGGLAAVLNEFAEQSGTGFAIDETRVPVSPATRAAADILGLDPLQMACEGRFVAVLPAERAEEALALLRAVPTCAEAALIGTVVDAHPGKVVAKTAIGGERLLDIFEGEPLPRIC
jgi:hydrogenase expression/formation protein HypE